MCAIFARLLAIQFDLNDVNILKVIKSVFPSYLNKNHNLQSYLGKDHRLLY